MPNYSYICGFELGNLAECYSVTGSPTVQSTYKRTGSYALQCNAAGSRVYVTFKSVAAGAVARSIFGAMRIYLRILTLPSPTSVNFALVGGSFVYLNTDGRIGFNSTGPWSTNSLSVDGTFHKFSFVENGGTATLFVDNISWITDSRTITPYSYSYLGVISDVTADLVFDDILVASDNNAGVDFPAGQVILLPAVSDNTDGTWTAGAGGASLFDAVDSIPPIGAATPTNLTQITNVDKTGNQDALLNGRTYTDGGIAAGDTVNATMAICCDGEQVNTGTKAGSIRTSSNPADAGAYTFDFGDDVGALGNFPTNWKTHVGPTTSAPSVTKGSSPVITVRKTDSTTRACDVCFLGVYVDYAPPVSTAEYVHGKEIPAGTIRGVQRGTIRMYR